MPHTIHTVLTGKPVPTDHRRQAVERGIPFTDHARHEYAFHHIFDRICDDDGIEHRPTQVQP